MRSSYLFGAPCLLAVASAVNIQKMHANSCESQDAKNRNMFQSKLAGLCEDMCKEVGIYPKCKACVGFAPPDSTPGVMTWEELLEHMDNLVAWGHETAKGWRKQAAALQMQVNVSALATDAICLKQDMAIRTRVQNTLAGFCVEMCKEIGASPQCQCPDFVAPDSTPGVMTWPELVEHMNNLVRWTQEQVQSWHKQTSQLQVQNIKNDDAEHACETEELAHRTEVQNALAGFCEEMCKEVGAYPEKCTCPGFVQPDATPGVMTWDELLEFMDKLDVHNVEILKGWRTQAAKLFLQRRQSHRSQKSDSCIANDLAQRKRFQSKLAGECEDMCKHVSVYPQCTQCKNMVQPDSTPGFKTWPELIQQLKDLKVWTRDTIKQRIKESSLLSVKRSVA